MNGPSTMTVAELQEALNNFSPDALVVFASDYGDISHTMQVTGIDEIEESHLEENAYSKSGWALPYPGGDEDEDEDEDTSAPDFDTRDREAAREKALEERQTYVVLR